LRFYFFFKGIAYGIEGFCNGSFGVVICGNFEVVIIFCRKFFKNITLGIFNFADEMSPLGNASAEACADYCLTLFSDLTKFVTMQNLFHDGGYSTTGITSQVMEKWGE